MSRSTDAQRGQNVEEPKSVESPVEPVDTDSKEGSNDYVESEDEDYDPTAKNDLNDNSNGESDDDQDFHQESNFDKLGLSSGGLIKTRRQRETEKQEKEERKAVKCLKPSVDIDSVWEQLRKDSKETRKRQSHLSSVDEDPKAPNSGSIDNDEMITIKTSYEFAGKTIFQTKKVHVNSAEAKAYLNSVKLKNNSSKPVHKLHYNTSQILSDGKVAKRMIRRKRPSLIDKLLSDPTASKLSTLEKSRLDWARYVDKHDIDAQLKSHNKGGYLEKQDFLARVDQNKDKNYRGAKTASTKD